MAPNGARRTKTDHPALPITEDELAEAAAACAEAGAAMIHVHVRDRRGRHLLDAEAYRAATRAIRQRVGDALVIQITTEAADRYAAAEQTQVLRATRPEAASLALREFVSNASQEAGFAELLAWMARENVLPQIILYDPADAVALADMQRRGLVPWDSIPVLFVLGRYSEGQHSEPSDLLPFLAPEVPRFAHWSICAFGADEAACVATGALLGGHVRVGLENNMTLPDGSLAPNNAALIEKVVELLSDAGRSVASADDLRDDISRCLRR